MGSIFTMIRDTKSVLRELKEVLKITLRSILGITNIMQDVDDITRELKDTILLLQTIEVEDDKGREFVKSQIEAMLTKVSLTLANLEDRKKEKRQGLESVRSVVMRLLEVAMKVEVGASNDNTNQSETWRDLPGSQSGTSFYS